MKSKNTQLPATARALRDADPYLEQERQRYQQPLPSRGYMLQLLIERGTPMPVEELVALFAIQPDEADFFQRRLNAMVREGDIVINRKGAICVADKLDLIKGRVQGHADGFGFIVPDDGTADLFVSPKEMYKALHGDRVMVREIGVDRRGRREGKIVEVLERVNKLLVGRLFDDRGVRFVVAEEKRISQDILIEPGSGSLTAEPGQVVMVELLTQPSHYAQPMGRIVQVLGNYGDPGMEIEIALRKHDLPREFPDAAQRQADKTPQKVGRKDWQLPEGLERVDLRAMDLVTIDGETARDFDDAVYAERQGSDWRLVVAIADVSHYVRPGDTLDQESYERGTSVYFPRRVIPMLPEALSNGICSLNPDVERLCMVCDMVIGARGKVKSYRFYPAVMRSKARFTYNEVWEILQQPKGEAAKRRAPLVAGLQDLYALFKVLLRQRQKRGAIDFETTETVMEFNDHGKIERIVPVKRNDAHRLIEECMLAANVCAADYLGGNKHTALYRIHQGPTEQKLETLRRFLAERGLELGGGDEPEARDYAELIAQIKSRPDAALLQTLMLRSLQQAVYSPERLGHFGLAYDAYTHFTSPIRRYPDLLVHRSIKAVLAGTQYRPGDWGVIGSHCSSTERRADEATRDVENWLKCFYMRDKLGEEFDGTVTAATGFGLFVMLEGLYVEGLVHISELGSDYFHYDATSHCLRGERSGRVFGLTDRLRVKVVRVDLETSRIELVPVEPVKVEGEAAGVARGARKGRAKPEAPGEAAAPVAAAQPAASATTETAAPANKSSKRGKRKGKARAPKVTPSVIVEAKTAESVAGKSDKAQAVAAPVKSEPKRKAEPTAKAGGKAKPLGNEAAKPQAATKARVQKTAAMEPSATAAPAPAKSKAKQPPAVAAVSTTADAAPAKSAPKRGGKKAASDEAADARSSRTASKPEGKGQASSSEAASKSAPKAKSSDTAQAKPKGAPKTQSAPAEASESKPAAKRGARKETPALFAPAASADAASSTPSSTRKGRKGK